MLVKLNPGVVENSAVKELSAGPEKSSSISYGTPIFARSDDKRCCTLRLLPAFTATAIGVSTAGAVELSSSTLFASATFDCWQAINRALVVNNKKNIFHKNHLIVM